MIFMVFLKTNKEARINRLSERIALENVAIRSSTSDTARVKLGRIRQAAWGAVIKQIERGSI